MRAILTLAAAVVTVFPDIACSGSAKDVFAEVYNGIVVVTTLDADGIPTAQGSGVVVGRNEVVTNCHVISGGSGIAVKQAAGLQGRESYRLEATLTARNDERDLCLLHVEELSDPPAAVPVRLGVSGAVSIGEEVYAIGAPQGLHLSLTQGIVSQLRHVFGREFPPLIQTDAAISPGSSGGGLFNDKGELIGITTFKYSGDSSEGISFALPTEWVRDLVAKSQGRASCLSFPTADCLFEAALELAETIEDESSRARALHAISEAQVIASALAKDEAGAKAALVDAIEIAERAGDESSFANKLATIAAVQTEMGDIDGALNTAARIENTLRRNEVLTNVATVQAKAGEIEGALRTAHRIFGTYDRNRSLAAIVAERTKAMDIAGAVFAARQVNDAFHRGEALSDIASVQADAGDIPGAFQTVEKIDYRFWRYRSLATVAIAQGNLGDEAGANATFAAAKKVAQQLDDASERASAMAFIAVSRAVMAVETKNKARARSMIDAAIRTADHASVRFMLENDIAVAQAKAGDIEGALESWRHSSNKYSVLDAIATEMIDIGELVGALELADRVNGVARRDDLRNRKTSEPIAESRSKSSGSGPNISSSNTIQTPSGFVLVPVPGQKETNWRTAALAAIAEAQAKAADFSGAQRTVERIIDDPAERDRLLTIIAVMRAGTGDFPGASRVIEQIDNTENRDMVAMAAVMGIQAMEEGDNIIGSLTRTARDATGALQLAAHIEDTGMRIGAFTLIAIGIAGAKWTLSNKDVYE